MSLYITNKTHWRTPDIECLVQACIEGADADRDRARSVSVVYHIKRRVGPKHGKVTRVASSEIDYRVTCRKRSTEIILKLPKTGPKEIHSNAMVAIAAVAAAPSNGALLSPAQTFWLAHGLVFELAHEEEAILVETERVTKMMGVEHRQTVFKKDMTLMSQFTSALGSDSIPVWADADRLLICKVKDPKLDGTYLAFIKKKETALKRAKTAIVTETKAIADAQRRLKAAKARKKTIEKSLESARERRA